MRKPTSAKRQRALVYALFLALPIIFFTFAYIGAIGYTARLSLFAWDGISPTQQFVGLANYQYLISQPRFLHAVGNNIAWLVFYLLGPSTLGLMLALLVDGRLRGEAVMKVIIFLPYILTPVAVAAIWRWMYLPGDGLFNAVLFAVGLGGLAHNWLGQPDTVNGAVMLTILWCGTGFSFLVFFTGLRAIPVEQIEAARIDAASPFTIFRRIVLPQLWPSVILVLGIFGIEAMRIFDIVWATSGGGPARASEVLSTYLYDEAFSSFKMGRASAIGIFQLLLAAVLILPYIAYIASRVEEQSE